MLTFDHIAISKVGPQISQRAIDLADHDLLVLGEDMSWLLVDFNLTWLTLDDNRDFGHMPRLPKSTQPFPAFERRMTVMPLHI